MDIQRPKKHSLRHRNVATVTRCDLDKMLQPSPITTIEQIKTIKKQKEDEKADQRAQAKARKDKMLKVRRTMGVETHIWRHCMPSIYQSNELDDYFGDRK